MKRTPLILGAIPLTIFAGAAIGTSVTADPIGRTANPLEQIPQHEIETRTADEARAMTATRDQYPLETPDGVIEVGELAYHGRLRDRMREQPLYGAETEAEAFGVVEDTELLAAESDAGNAYAGAPIQPANFVPLEEGVFENTDNTAAPADTKTAPAVQHTRFAERNETLEGKARVIDVEAQLNR